MNKRVTYLIGAGASFCACPIWKEQGEKMIEMAVKYLPNGKNNFDDKKSSGMTEQESILWDIGYFGSKSLEYGTIDTYAKKLYLNNDYDRELQRLKLAVSIFFTLWESSNTEVKKRNGEKMKNIDNRYISLFASILEKGKNGTPKLKDNIRFVTWNYDLQLERAFKTFCLDHLDFDNIQSNLSFRINNKTNGRDLEICHLNGYNGYYYINGKNEEHDTLNRTDSKDLMKILDEIGFTGTSVTRGQIQITDHINFAWENGSLSKTAREQAKKIFGSTDILVIIGYSFPPFNKEIDTLLFNELSSKKTTIYYQDPQASKDYLQLLTSGFDCEIHPLIDRPDHFYLPYDF